MNPTLTSSSGSGQNEPFRINRLEKVSKIYNIQIADSNDQELSEILSLHDHKGELTVTWTNEPTDEQKHIIGLIWELQNELGENVVHKLELEED
jgi:hypothetical protein